jgi:prepilin-type processing-associated H-X9-DG protein
MTKMSSITDGSSNTYLAGEKFCDSDHYTDGLSAFDDEGWDTGWDWDTVRWSGTTTYPPPQDTGHADVVCRPIQDTPGLGTGFFFGSAHAIGFNMAFCDGSVQFINYSVNLETHYRLGNIADGKTIDAKAY